MTRSLSSIDVFERRAQDYQAKYMSVELYHEALDRLCMAVQTLHADVLEVGCGPGNVTRYLLQQRPDLRILAVDLAPTMLKRAHQQSSRVISTDGLPRHPLTCPAVPRHRVCFLPALFVS
ncbi:MAG: class I SAM-dependent methyltransferase [Sandaracinaceae bacterium]|nr:class I SAM-dependent methyltransferase [Sandaracinaceae bacterium]